MDGSLISSEPDEANPCFHIAQHELDGQEAHPQLGTHLQEEEGQDAQREHEGPRGLEAHPKLGIHLQEKEGPDAQHELDGPQRLEAHPKLGTLFQDDEGQDAQHDLDGLGAHPKLGTQLLYALFHTNHDSQLQDKEVQELAIGFQPFLELLNGLN